jgi:AcrR family transcriptional regulator
METPPSKLPADERRATTVQAVVELASTQNPSDITTAAIAKHMHVTQGALFRHFASKSAIWQSVMEWVADRLLARVDRAIEGIESPLAALEAMLMAHIDFVAQHPGVPRMIFGELQQPAPTPAKRMVETLLMRYRDRLRAHIEKGRENGELLPSLETDAAVVLFVGMVQGNVMQTLIVSDPGQMRRDAPRMFAVYRRGIARAS